jgi:hypothetical protein
VPPQSAAASATLARSLSGYLCGTHSGVLRHRQGDRVAPRGLGQLADASHRPEASTTMEVGGERLEGDLAERLRHVLTDPAVVDLVVFGSLARASTTGFSDVDAILVLDDQVVRDPGALKRLRRSVLRAERSILAYQPMQHHGLEVVTAGQLAQVDAATGLPAPAFACTKSLFGRRLEAGVAATADLPRARRLLGQMARTLAGYRAWPRHPWNVHRLISMFELLPALFLQARGEAIRKHLSFAAAARHFGADWWPYERLAQVRDRWPRTRRPGLESAARVVRNPWVAVTAWTRLPIPAPPVARELLDAETLAALGSLSGRMAGGEA